MRTGRRCRLSRDKIYYPGAKVEMQSLGERDGAPADELHVRTAQGQHLTLYFDISSFFGKGF